MALRLELHGPATVHPGEVIRYELELVGQAEQVTGVELAVRGSRGYSISGQARYVKRDDLAAVRYTAGHRRFPIDVLVPNAPSHQLPNQVAWAALWVEARVTGPAPIEQWFPLHVRQRIDNPRLEPTVVRATQYVELALGLAATRAAGGTTLVGECSISGHHGEARIAVDVLCTLHANTGRLVLPIQATTLRVPRHANAVPFTLELPAYLAPSLEIDTHKIQYQVRATHKQWRKTTVSVPLHIVDARPAPARIQPPHVGVDKVEPVFAEVATRAGWRIGPSVDAHPELGTITPWIYAAQAGLVLRLGYAYRDDGSTFLISRIRYQPLELGLHVVPSRFGGSAVSSANPEWDRAHAVTARDRVRAATLLIDVVPELAPLGSLLRWDDDWLICERPITGLDVALLDEVARALRAVSRKLASAIGIERELGPYR